MTENCVFCRIANGSIPAEKVYENDEFVAFRDLNPQAPVHVLLIPRQHFDTLLNVEDTALLGRALRCVQEVAKQLGLADDGFRVVVNCRENGGQTVYHLHWHILGGRFMTWPPG